MHDSPYDALGKSIFENLLSLFRGIIRLQSLERLDHDVDSSKNIVK